MQSITSQIIDKCHNSVPKRRVEGYKDYIIVELASDVIKSAIEDGHDNYDPDTNVFTFSISIMDLIKQVIAGEDVSEFMSKMRECVIDGKLKQEMCFGDMDKVFRLLHSIKSSDCLIYTDDLRQVEWTIERVKELQYGQKIKVGLKNPLEVKHIYFFFGSKSTTSLELACLV